MKRLSAIITTALLMMTCQVWAGTTVNYFQTDNRYSYRTALLALALSYSNLRDPSDTIRLTALPDLPHARGLRLLKENSLRAVVSLATNQTREKEMRAIRIPILSGILGIRVFLIHKDNQEKLSNIEALKQLRQVPLGFVSHWGDTEILNHNEMNVIPVVRYETMFAMLNARRFDFIPRGVNEILPELKRFKKEYPNLTIETNNALWYPYPVYFFVNKNDTDLAERIEYGLQRARDNGSMERLFNQHHQHIFEALNFNERKIYRLENPTLPPNTEAPIDNQWINLEHIEK